MDKPFLIGKSESQLFGFLSMSGEEKNLMKALQKMRSDLQEYTLDYKYQIGALDTVSQYLKEAKDQYVKFTGFPDLFTRILALEQEYTDFEVRKKALESLVGFQTVLHRTEDELKAIGPVVEKLSGYVEKMEGLLSKMESKKQVLIQVTKRAKEYEERALSVSELREKIKLFDGIDQLRTMRDEAGSQVERIKKISEVYRRFFQALANRREEEERKGIIKVNYNKTIEELSEFKTCPLCGSNLEGDTEHGI